MRDSRLRRLMSGLGLGYIHTIATIAVGLWLTPYLLRHLGSHDYGLWLLGMQILAYLALMDLGVIALIPREVAALTGQRDGDEARLRELYGQTARLTLWQLPVVGLVGLTMLWLLPADWTPLRWPMAIALVTFVLLFPLRIFAAALQGLQRLAATGLAQITSWAIGVVTTVVLASGGLGLYALAIGWVATQVTSVALSWWQLRAAHPEIFPERLPRLDIAVARRHLSQSIWISVSQIAQVLLVGTDIVVIGKLLGPEAVVTFACTARLVTLLANQPQMLMQTALPALSELRASAPRDRLVEVSKGLAQVMLLLSGAIVVVVLAVNEPFVAWWVGDSRFGGIGLTGLLLASMLARHVNATLTYTLFCFGNERRLALTSIADGAVAVVSMLILIPQLGLHGAALGSLIATCAVSLPRNLSALGRELGASPLEFVQPLRLWFARFPGLVGVVALVSEVVKFRGLVSFMALGAGVGCAYALAMLPVLRTPPLSSTLIDRLPTWFSTRIGLIPRTDSTRPVASRLESLR